MRIQLFKDRSRCPELEGTLAHRTCLAAEKQETSLPNDQARCEYGRNGSLVVAEAFVIFTKVASALVLIHASYPPQYDAPHECGSCHFSALQDVDAP